MAFLLLCSATPTPSPPHPRSQSDGFCFNSSTRNSGFLGRESHSRFSYPSPEVDGFYFYSSNRSSTPFQGYEGRRLTLPKWLKAFASNEKDPGKWAWIYIFFLVAANSHWPTVLLLLPSSTLFHAYTIEVCGKGAASETALSLCQELSVILSVKVSCYLHLALNLLKFYLILTCFYDSHFSLVPWQYLFTKGLITLGKFFLCWLVTSVLWWVHEKLWFL